MITVKDLKKDKEVQAMISIAEEQLEALGFTEHSNRHLSIVSNMAGDIMRAISSSDEEIWQAEIAGYLHDIGNTINRNDHAQSGALLAYSILTSRGVPYIDAGKIMMAIGNHDETQGLAVSRLSAALIIADKADVHRSRVRFNKRKLELVAGDIHDRVNFAAVKSFIEIINKVLTLNIEIDTTICPVIDYFEIYFNRMKMCRQAARQLDLHFSLVINNVKML